MIIACIISFTIGAMLMMCAIGLMSYQKDKKPRNKVHFYVTVGALGGLELWIGKPIYGYNMWVADDKNCSFLCKAGDFYSKFNFFAEDFHDMKPGEIREVFLNLED